MASGRGTPSTSTLADRLQLKSGLRVLTFGLPASVRERLQGVALTARVPAEVEAALVFGRSAAELEARLARLDGRLAEDPLLWLCYPKGGAGVETDLKREAVWEVAAPHHLRPVAQVAVDGVWSALRFRRVEAVGRPRVMAPSGAAGR
jgi:hypothetical protein